MKLFDYVWFNMFHDRIDELKQMAMQEDWDYKKNPLGCHPILENYVKHTFAKLYEEGKILTQGNYAVFNVGLVTELQEEIYALLQQNKRPGTTIPWFFIGWKKASDRDLLKFTTLPENANYFNSTTDLKINISNLKNIENTNNPTKVKIEDIINAIKSVKIVYK